MPETTTNLLNDEDVGFAPSRPSRPRTPQTTPDDSGALTDADVGLVSTPEGLPVPSLRPPPGVIRPPNESQLPLGVGPIASAGEFWNTLNRGLPNIDPISYGLRKWREASMKEVNAAPPSAGKTAAQVLEGLNQTTEGVQDSFRSPLGIALLLGGGPLPGWFHKLVGAGFSIQAIRNIFDQSKDLKKAIADKDPQAISRAASGIVADTIQAGLGALPFLPKGSRKITLPQTPPTPAMEALAEKSKAISDPTFQAYRRQQIDRRIAELEVDPHVTGQRITGGRVQGQSQSEPVVQDKAKVQELAKLKALQARLAAKGGEPQNATTIQGPENAQQGEVPQASGLPPEQRQPAQQPAKGQAQAGTPQRGGTGQEAEIGEPTPHEVTTTKLIDNKPTPRPTPSADYFAGLGDQANNPETWSSVVDLLLKPKFYGQEGAYQIGLYLRQLGAERARPVIAAIEQARENIVQRAKTTKSPEDMARIFGAQFLREGLESAHEIKSGRGHIPAEAAAPLKTEKTGWPKTELEAAKPSPAAPPAAATNLRPAIRTPNGKIFTGDDHLAAADNAKRNGQPDLTGMQEGFLDASGKFISRETAAQQTGLPTEKEPGKLHASDLEKTTPAPHNIIAAMEGLGLKIRNKKASKPGEEDFYATGSGYDKANRGAGAARFAPEGRSPDRVLVDLKDAGEISQDATVEDLWNAIDKANDLIQTHNKGETPEARLNRFMNDTDVNKPLQVKGKPRKYKANTNDLEVGATFSVNGIEWTVTAIDPDAEEISIRSDQGYTINIPDNMPFAIDHGAIAAPTQQEFFGPGAAGAAGAGATVPPAGAVGSVYSGTAPLQELALVVRRFPKQKGSFGEKMRQWMDSVGIPVKDRVGRAFNSVRALPTWIKTQATTLPTIDDLDRRVGQWNAQDWTGSFAARLFSKAVRFIFPNRAKLRALSNWINAGGDKALLARQAALTRDPALRKTYEDALAFGPDEERLAGHVRQYHDEMLAWAQREGALADGLENYLHRYYRPDDPVLQRKLAAVEYLRFSKDFNGFKRRYYDSDFEAEQHGLSPEKDAAKRILAYDYGFRQALTAREFVRKSFGTTATAKDGRPELDVVGGGFRIPGDPATNQKPVTLIKPKWRQDTGDPMDYRGDYVRFEHPAFKKWHFASTDSAGNPILVDGDILVHPDFAKKYAALFEKSWWGKTPFRRGLQAVSSFVKQTMLQGPFHLVQITTGGIEHRINPFKLMELDPSNPDQIRMAEAGLFAGDQGGRYMTEGVSGGLLEKIPVAGEYFQTAKDWLFNDYIPRWKMTLALEAEKRNLARYRDDIRTGKISREQVTRMSARQAAAVFGGQNQRAIYRSKTFQDTLRFLFLAPDFGEERLRQVVQAGGKYGHEQRAALVAGAVGLIVLAKTTEKLLTGKMDLSPKHIFSVTYNGKEYSLRNPASDIAHLVTDPIGYLRNRLNPVYTRPLLELATGRDAFGRKRSYGQQLKDEIKQVVPIPARGFVEKEQTVLDSFLNSTGLTEHRRSDFTDQMKKINAWKQSRGYVEPGEFVYDPDKDPYHPLTTTLGTGSVSQAQKQLAQYLAGKGPVEKVKLFQHYARSLAPNRPFTGSYAHEQEYLKTLSLQAREDYQSARRERLLMWQKFLKAWRGIQSASRSTETLSTAQP